MATPFKLSYKDTTSDIVKRAMGNYARSQIGKQRSGAPSGVSLGQFGGQLFKSMRGMNPQQNQGLSYGKQFVDSVRDSQPANYVPGNPNWRTPEYQQPSPSVYQTRPQEQFQQPMITSPGFREQPATQTRQPARMPLNPRNSLIKQRAMAQRKSTISKPTNPNTKSM